MALHLLGWLAILGGGGWTLLTVWFMGFDAPEWVLTLLIAAPGAVVALIGCGMAALGSRGE